MARRIRSVLLVGALVGIAYQLVGTFLIEPVIARATSGEVPDVSAFRSTVGNEAQLLYRIAVAWTLGAFLEEVAYRGWVMTRFAEVGRFSSGAWMSAAAASSILFGIVHIYQDVSGVIATALTGLVFAGVYLTSGRISGWPSSRTES